MPELLMHIIRFVMPSRSKLLKKLLYFYYELSNKHDSNNKLRQEWILGEFNESRSKLFRPLVSAFQWYHGTMHQLKRNMGHFL